MTDKVYSPKKLIEVTIPLDEINKACVREKSIRHGHPSTLHLWWARRPLAAARAVIFASMVNDPGYVNKEFRHGVNKVEAEKKRAELCQIIRDLVVWENSNNPTVLKRAKNAMMESWQEICKYNKDHPRAKELFNPEHLPAFHDPFAGGGALPLEAERLGLESYASDLNPVPVMLNKAMIEIPPRFRGTKPIGPVPQGESSSVINEWANNAGLAEDVRRYGMWIRKKAQEQIGTYYEDVEISTAITKDRPDLTQFLGKRFPIVALIWARTIKSTNPMFSDVDVPLVTSFCLSKKKGNEAYIQPVIDGKGYYFEVKRGICPSDLQNGTKESRGCSFKCLLSGSPISVDFVKTYGAKGAIGSKLMAIVVDSGKRRIYLSPKYFTVKDCKAPFGPQTKLAYEPRALWVVGYGFKKFADLFSNRQLLALTTFSSLISGCEGDQTVSPPPQPLLKRVEKDAIAAGMADDKIHLRDGGSGALAYAEAIALYMSFVVDKCADYWSTICTWNNSRENIRNTFGRQAIPMTWDFAESNPFSEASGSWLNMVQWVSKAVANFPSDSFGHAYQANALTQHISKDKVVSTDPPYYDNIGYADLSDFFYVWLRRNLRDIYPDVCSTLATPKQDELIASQYRHKSKEGAEQFFLGGMTEVMKRLCEEAHPAFPVTIYYAFKQSETKAGATTNTGWVTFLEAVIRAGFQITGTWPMRTERPNRSIAVGNNALASSIVLVCRRRDASAPTVSRRQFQRELKDRLSVALDEMTGNTEGGSIAPVDLSQAIIGPGMEIFSQYSNVLEADGTPLSVDAALKMINNFLDEDAFDRDTQFCLSWFRTFGWDEGDFGTADNLARAKGISVEGLSDGGVLTSEKGIVRLLHWKDLPQDWDPRTDTRISTWEACHHFIRILQIGSGIDGAAVLLSRMRSFNANIPMFCSTMYTLCERLGWNDDAKVYNELSLAWPDIEERSQEIREEYKQESLDF